MNAVKVAEPSALVLQVLGKVGVITLNNAKASNSLSPCLMECIQMALKEWRNKLKMVVIRAEGPIFSAGADLMKAASYAQRYNCLPHMYTVYAKTMKMVNEYPGNVVCLVQSPAMGIGVSLINASKISVLQETCWLSKPESSIGFCVDFGSSHSLSRLPYSVGKYLALTGERILARDSTRLGFTGAMCTKDKFRELEDSLVNLQNPTSDDIESTIKRHGSPNIKLALKLLEDNVHKHFSKDTVLEILQSLESDSSKWSQDTLSHLRKLSPVSLLVSNKILEAARSRSYFECLYHEAPISRRVMQFSDYYAAVENFKQRKSGLPKWSYPRVEDVPEEVIEGIFRPPTLQEIELHEILKQDDVWSEETSALFREFEEPRKDLEEMKSRIDFNGA